MKGYLVDGKMSEEAWETQVKDLAVLGGWKYYHTYRNQHSPAGKVF